MAAKDLPTAQTIAHESAAIAEEIAGRLSAMADAVIEGRRGEGPRSLRAMSAELAAEAERLRRI